MSDEALLSPVPPVATEIPTTTGTVGTTGIVEAVDVPALQAERATIRRACERIDALFARDAPAGDAAVTAELGEALTALSERWSRHARLAEAPDGLLHRIIADAPHLTGPVARLSTEHAQVSQTLLASRAQLSSNRPDPDGARLLFERARSMIETHRRRGNTVLFDAYTVDLGLGD